MSRSPASQEDKKLLVIVGITGSQGTSVARTFQPLPDWRVRGISRSPESSSSQNFASQGIEIVQGDLNNPSTLLSAFRGAHAIFATTTFWSGATDPEIVARHKKDGTLLNELCYEVEKAQGRNIADAAAKVLAEDAQLKRFVFSTLSHSKKWSKGKIDYCLHFDSKAETVEYIKQSHPALAKRSSWLQLGLFMSNWQMGDGYAPDIVLREWSDGPGYTPVKQKDGSYLVQVGMKSDAKAPWVDPNRDTGSFVKALIETDPGQNLVGYGSMISMQEWSETFSRVKGVKCRHKPMSRAEMERRMPGGFGKEMMDMNEYIEEFGLDGSDPSALHPSQLGIEVAVTTLEDYFQITDFSPTLDLEISS